jgi:hypothetical protein
MPRLRVKIQISNTTGCALRWGWDDRSPATRALLDIRVVAPLRQDKVKRMSCRVLAPSPSGRGRGVRELAAWRTPLKPLTLSRWERGQKVRFV